MEGNDYIGEESEDISLMRSDFTRMRGQKRRRYSAPDGEIGPTSDSPQQLVSWPQPPRESLVDIRNDRSRRRSSSENTSSRGSGRDLPVNKYFDEA